MVLFSQIDAEDTTMNATQDEIVTINCGKCAGVGRLWIYAHREAGICYGCMGKGIQWQGTRAELDAIEARREKRRQQRVARAEREQAKRQQRFDAWLAGNPGAQQIAIHQTETNTFVIDLQNAMASGRTLSDRQIEAGVQSVNRDNERAEQRRKQDAEATNAPEGRIEVEGTVVSFKTYESQWGITHKMLVDCGTYRLFGTIPAAISKVEQGQRVTFTAQVEPKERGFGTFKRPTKARVL